MTATTVRTRPHGSAFGKLLGVETKLFLRAPMALVWTVVIPVGAILVMGLVPGTRQPLDYFGGASVLATYLPIVIAFTATMSAVNVLPVTLATYRERGFLRRFAATPVPPSYVLAVQVVLNLAVQVLVAVLAVLTAAAFGTPLPAQPVGFALAFLLLAAATSAVGLLVAAVCRGARVAGGVAMVLFFVLMFFSGLWLPRTAMPEALRTVSDGTPMGAGVQALQDAASGDFPRLLHLVVLAAYAVVCSVLASRLFRWE